MNLFEGFLTAVYLLLLAGIVTIVPYMVFNWLFRGAAKSTKKTARVLRRR